MTFVVHGDDAVLEQVRKQLDKIVTIVKVQDISGEDFVERDLMLIKVNAAPERRMEIALLVEMFRGADRRHQPDQPHDRDFRPGAEDRGLHRADAAVRHRRAGPHRPDRPGPRHAGRGDVL